MKRSQKYLPQEVLDDVTGADQMTVRMLLNHTSGVAEYNGDAAYVSYLLEHPLHVFTTMDYLDYIKGDKVQFPAGSKYLLHQHKLFIACVDR
jgi:D-alanyl-D-alanine carboxypeptidase